jgi:hypothetical protein
MIKKFILIISLVIVVFAKDISVIGFGDTQIEAKKSALKELSNQIEVSLQSNMITTKSISATGEYEKDVVSTFNQISTTKFLGLEYGKFDALHKTIKITLPTLSYKLYINRMSKILEELKYNQEAIKSLKTDVQN